MKIAIITDTHIGGRKNSHLFHDYFEKFYDEVFFPELDKRGIRTIVHTGDCFDNRNSIDLKALSWAKRVIFNPAKKRGIDVIIISGNHDVYYKNTNNISSVDLLLKEYSNVYVYCDPEEIVLGGLDVVLVPWINQENESKTLDILAKTQAKVAMGHLELNGFIPHKGHVMDEGRDPSPFNKFEKVFSGHYHTRSDDGRIFYIGNPYEMFFSDVDDDRGFVIFDTKTLDHEYVNNPNRMHHVIYYEDTPYKTLNPEIYDNKIVKLVVRKKTDIKNFDRYINRLYDSSIAEIKIIENYVEHQVEMDEFLENEDTMSLLKRYVDNGTIDFNKDILKNILNEIYQEACEQL